MEELLKVVGNETNPLSPEYQQLEQLSEQIAAYEEQHFPFEAQTLQEMIELLMYQRKLRQKDLAHLLGISPSRISEVLNGKRTDKWTPDAEGTLVDVATAAGVEPEQMFTMISVAQAKKLLPKDTHAQLSAVIAETVGELYVMKG